MLMTNNKTFPSKHANVNVNKTVQRVVQKNNSLETNILVRHFVCVLTEKLFKPFDWLKMTTLGSLLVQIKLSQFDVL